MWFSLNAQTDAAIRELEASSDRAAAIIAGAVIDSLLYDTIAKFLRGDNEAYSAKIRKDLFSAGGALGSFGSRTGLAYLIGLVSAEAHSDLQTLGKIRNSFAHYTERDTFDTQSIKTRCDDFKLVESRVLPGVNERTHAGPKMLQDAITFMLPDNRLFLNLVEHDKVLATARGRFISTTKLFLAAFSNFQEEPHDERKLPIL